MAILTPIPFHLILVAAGSGSRMGGGVPKQYRPLRGKPVIRHALDAFADVPGLQSVTIATMPGDEENLADTLSSFVVIPNVSEGSAITREKAQIPHFVRNDRKKVRTVPGGATRRDSVYNALKALDGLDPDTLILIHDAARPFVTTNDIRNLIDAAFTTGAATLAHPLTDTIRRDDGTYIDRTGLWSIQTPQAFRYGLLRRAHETKPLQAATDDTFLVTASGHDVAMVAGSRLNIKLTTPEDWLLAEHLMSLRTETRVGTGFDVHAFARDKPGPVRLGGIDIPHDHALDGHSDADVGLHALTDALLGALALGDIGQHFPPSDPQWKGASSDLFLQHAVKLANDSGARIVHLDLTLICEAPKIGPHHAAMRQHIADICTIDISRVSVKATTTERLGFTGRREGIAAQALATLEMPCLTAHHHRHARAGGHPALIPHSETVATLPDPRLRGDDRPWESE